MTLTLTLTLTLTPPLTLALLYLATHRALHLAHLPLDLGLHAARAAPTECPRVTRCLGCHGTRYVPNARGWSVYPVRTVRGAWGPAALCVRYVPNAGGWYA